VQQLRQLGVRLRLHALARLVDLPYLAVNRVGLRGKFLGHLLDRGVLLQPHAAEMRLCELCVHQAVFLLRQLGLDVLHGASPCLDASRKEDAAVSMHQEYGAKEGNDSTFSLFSSSGLSAL
jgi:hypothetical protein